MLQQILRDMYIDPDLLAELDEEQKQVLFCKIRQEQVRRWKEREETLEAEQKKSKTAGTRQPKIKFLEGKDGQPWVWVMGEHENDKTLEQIITEEVQEKARKQAEKEAEQLRIQNEEAMQRLKEAESSLIEETKSQRQTATDEKGTEKRNQISSEKSTVKLRREVTKHTPRAVDIEQIKQIRSSEIFQSLEVARQRSLEEAEKEGKNMFAVWQEQEKKAKEAEQMKRLIAKRAREDNARAVRKLKTESQIIGGLTTSFLDFTLGSHKPIPGGISHPEGRPRRPANKDDVILWYKDVEERKGIGINPTTKQPADYFYGLISREQAEDYLANSSPGTFLVRLSDRVWGYALSYKTEDCCKHYLIDASDGQYRFFGSNQIVHRTLDDLVEHHKTTPFSIVGKELLRCPPTSSDKSRDQSLDADSIALLAIPEIEISYL